MDTNSPPQSTALRGGQEALARGAWKEARPMLAEAGFSEVEVEQIEGDIFNSYFIATKGQRT